MSTTLVFVGIDVTKARLNIALRPSGQQWSVSHDGLGITRVVERLRTLQPTLVVLQATGGLELALTGALMAAGLPLVVVHPRQVRDFAKATEASPLWREKDPMFEGVGWIEVIFD